MTGTRQQILVIDDSPLIADMVRDVLLEEGYDVRTAGNGREALNILSTWRADAILLDLAMPGMDGQAFLQARADNPEPTQAPVIVMSANRNLAATVSRLPITAVLSKPFQIDHLLAIVRDVTDLTGR